MNLILSLSGKLNELKTWLIVWKEPIDEPGDKVLDEIFEIHAWSWETLLCWWRRENHPFSYGVLNLWLNRDFGES